jgi:hypothetical protein
MKNMLNRQMVENRIFLIKVYWGFECLSNGIHEAMDSGLAIEKSVTTK